MRKSWTDEEMGYIADTFALPAMEVARQLGRSPDAVYKARSAVRSGWARTVEPWTEGEDDVVRTMSRYASAGQIASYLPGRTPGAIKSRRRVLNLPPSNLGAYYDPNSVGARKLIARTCRGCGNLLPARKFYFRGGKGGARRDVIPECANCVSSNNSNRDLDIGHSRMKRRAFAEAMDKKTRPTAFRAGYPYLESDFAVLADRSITSLDAALSLNRTYTAILGARRKFEREKFKTEFDSSDGRWLIKNPNK